MTPSELQRQSDQGDEHRDDVTVVQATAAIRRCEVIRYDAVAILGSDYEEHVGEGHRITLVRWAACGETYEYSSEAAVELVSSAERIWWAGDYLAATTNGVSFTLPNVRPAFRQAASCGYCGHTFHSGACDIQDAPAYRSRVE